MADDPKLVAVEALTKRYGKSVAIDDASITLPPGCIHGFIGANGAGKTTTLRMLAGILPPDRGRGEVLGFDIRDRYPQIRKHVGYAAQRLSLHRELSTVENLLFRARLYDLAEPAAAVEAVIREFDLGAYRTQRAGTLSGGWARRLQVAAAVIHRPRLILLDEPTAGLDATACQALWAKLRQFAAYSCAVIVNTHDLAEAERCDAISFFHDGRIAFQGPPAAMADSMHARSYLIDGPSAVSMEPTLSSLADILDSRREGDQLRVVIRCAGIPALQHLAGMHEVGLRAVGMRLADAALVYERQISAAAS